MEMSSDEIMHGWDYVPICFEEERGIVVRDRSGREYFDCKR